MIVDTAYVHSTSFRDTFDNYFVSKQRQLFLRADDLRERLDGLSVYPKALENRLFNYRVRFDKEPPGFVDSATGIHLGCGLSRQRRESVLLHHDSGGGEQSKYVFFRIRLQDEIVDALLERLRQIGGEYTALHIRNTDYQTRYQERIEQLAGSVAGPVFVATDSLSVLEDCQRVFGTERIVSFADLSFAVDNKPLHWGWATGADFRARNRDAILDLFLLAMASRLHLFELDRQVAGTPVYSGFSKLARNLSSSAYLLRCALGRTDPVFTRLLRYKPW